MYGFFEEMANGHIAIEIVTNEQKYIMSSFCFATVV